MKLVADDIETMRFALRAYWSNAGHSTEAPEALCDLALKGLSVPAEVDAKLPPEANELAAMARDAARYRAVKACNWIGLRVEGQEFVGVSNLDAWADARLSGPSKP